MKRKILAQGDRDGACFLYSIANSFLALTDKQVTQKKWMESICASPFRVDDFLSGGGTQRLDGSPAHLEGLCRDFLEKIQPEHFKVLGKKIDSDKSLRDLITQQQVIIVSIDNGNHWACVVDADDRYFYVACSTAALQFGSIYTENKSERFHRNYNCKLLFEELGLCDDYAMLVRRMRDT